MYTGLHALFALTVSSLFWDQILAVPTKSPLHDIFSSPDIPVLDTLDPSVFNVTAHHARTDKRAINVGYVLYSITMDGRNQGNYQNWVISGSLLLTQGIPSSGTQNGQNPYDVVIAIGNPAASPVAGSIRYATNRYLYKFIGGSNANSVLDFAFISSTSTSVGVTVDTRIAAANQLSNFNARSGVTASVYVVASGGFTLSFGATTLSGKINLVGRDYIFSGTGPYNALISGTVVGRGTTAI